MSTIRISQPSSEPVTLANVKEQLSIDTSDTLVDGVITRRIVEARQLVESMIGRSIMPCQWEVVLDGFSDSIELEYPPTSSVNSVKYIDTNSIEQTLSSAVYYVDVDSIPNKVVLAPSQAWPNTLDRINTVRIRYTAGYADAASVPGPIKEAIILIVGHWMRYQGAIEAGLNITRIPYAVECILAEYKVPSFG